MPLSTSVSIAVLTFRRPAGLMKALDSLVDAAARQRSELVVCEILVVDNDPSGSARQPVASRAEDLVRYVHEPTPGVAAARNRALDEASGDRLVFIDDDEHAGPNWPEGLIEVMDTTGAALVGGPVRSVLPEKAPGWAADLGFFDRDEPAHLSAQDWLRSGNLAIDLEPIRREGLRFDEAFGLTGGEDVRFSVLAKRRGLDLRWCDRAIVYEDVPIERIEADWVENRSRTAMANYVRANAPIALPFASRILLRAFGRIPFGLTAVISGRLTRNEARTLNGKVALARANGAFVGLATARREERGRRRTQPASTNGNAR